MDATIGVIEAVLAAEAEAPAPPVAKRRASGGAATDAAAEATAALERAFSALESSCGGGFDAATLDRLLALAASCAHASAGRPRALQIERRLLRAAAPAAATAVRTESVARVCSALTSAPPRARLPLLEWLLAAWPSLAPRALRPFYFAVFHQLQYDSLLEAAACILCRISEPSDVMPHRLRKLTRLFEKTGAPWAAALVCLYRKLEPELVVLPFDPHRAVGSDAKLARMLGEANVSGKAHAQWRADFAAARGEPPLPAPAVVVSSVSAAAASSSAQARNSVLPQATFFFDTSNGPRLDTAASIEDVAKIIASRHLTRLPDQLASAISSRPSLHFVGVAFAGKPSQLDRIQHWISHALRRHCRDEPWNPEGHAVIDAVCSFAGVLRELPPSAESELSWLLAPGSPWLHEASRMVQWLRPETFLGKETPYFSELLGPAIAAEGEERASVLTGMSLLVARLATVADTASAFVEESEFPERVSKEQIAGCLQAIADFVLEEAAAADPTPENADVFLAVVESLATCGEPVSFPLAYLAGLFHSQRADIVSRALSAAVAFASAYDAASAEGEVLPEWRSGLQRFVGLVHTELTQAESEHSLVSHPALQGLVAKYLSLARQAAPPDAEITSATAMAHRAPLLEFLSARGVPGLTHFHSHWPLL